MKLMRLGRLAFFAAFAVWPSHEAHADDPKATPPQTTSVAQNASTPLHLAQAFVQYGLAFTGEFVLASGPICNYPNAPPCIFGSGGGLALRVGARLRSPFYIGAAYEFAKMDPGQLYRLAILQQFRAEGRYYILTGHTTEPYISAGVGAVGYGNLWGIDTGGPTFQVGGGAEFQLSTYIVVGLSVTYRAMFFTRFQDSANNNRPDMCSSCPGPGFAHLLGVDLIVESRDPF